MGSNGINPIILKMKGTNKTLDTSKMVGLQRTEQNKAIFDRFDTDHNGVLDQNEAQNLTNALYSKDKSQNAASKDTKISQREMNRAFGKNTDTFAALNALADQQASIIDGKEYVETNGETKTRLYQSSVNSKYSYRAETQKDGTTKIINADGSYELDKGDTRELYTKDGKLTEIKHKGGGYEKYDPETGKIQEKYERIGEDQEVHTYYNADGQKIRVKEQSTDHAWNIQEFDPTSETPDEPTSIKVQSQNFEYNFKSLQDVENNRPTSFIKNPQYMNTSLEHLVEKTEYSYDDNGNVTAVRTFTNDKGESETETTLTDAEGNPIEAKPAAEPINFTVKAGASNNAVATAILKELGAEVNSENIKTVLEDLRSEMKYKHKGTPCFGANQKIIIPESLAEKLKPEQKTETKKEAPPEYIDVNPLGNPDNDFLDTNYA